MDWIRNNLTVDGYVGFGQRKWTSAISALTYTVQYTFINIYTVGIESNIVQVHQLSGLAYIPICRSPIAGRTVQRVIDFSIFDLGGFALDQSSPKEEMT